MNVNGFAFSPMCGWNVEVEVVAVEVVVPSSPPLRMCNLGTPVFSLELTVVVA